MNTSQYYLSCEHLEYNVVFFTDRIRVCCGDEIRRSNSLLPGIPIDDINLDNLDDLLSEFRQYKEQIVRNINSNKPIICKGCKYLRKDYWEKSATFKLVNFSTDYPCNLKCSYCFQNSKDYNYKTNYDIYKLISKVLQSKFISKQTQFIYACGELGIHPKAQELIQFFEGNKVSFFTNATKYFESMHQLICKPQNSMLVSIDSGTKETYRKIKGADLFETVCENLCRYAKNNGNVILKYILTHGNTSMDDLNGFIDFCVKANIHNIRIVYDWNITVANSQMQNAAIYLLHKAKKRKINCYVDESFTCERM